MMKNFGLFCLLVMLTLPMLVSCNSEDENAKAAVDSEQQVDVKAGLLSLKAEADKAKHIQETARTAEAGKESIDGVEYVKINVFELFDICERKDTVRIGDDFVMRGVVYNDGPFAADKQFLILRPTLWCCEEHSVSFGFRVDYDKLDSLRSGEWVKVRGKLSKSGGELKKDPTLGAGLKKIDLPAAVDIEKSWVFIPDAVERTSPPEQFHITYWNTKEPFYY
jgi:uncharacterized membrane protein YcgQ (UPF0703/DUF1980 family)